MSKPWLKLIQRGTRMIWNDRDITLWAEEAGLVTRVGRCFMMGGELRLPSLSITLSTFLSPSKTLHLT